MIEPIGAIRPYELCARPTFEILKHHIIVLYGFIFLPSK